MKYLAKRQKHFIFAWWYATGITRDSFTENYKQFFPKFITCQIFSPMTYQYFQHLNTLKEKKIKQKWEKTFCCVFWISWFVIVLMNWRQNSGYRNGSFQRWKACVVGLDKKAESMKNLSKTLVYKLASFFLAWFVLAVVLRSLGRWQKKRGTERYFVNLENCRTKGFTMERNTCLDTGQHGLEKSKLKHFVNDN